MSVTTGRRPLQGLRYLVDERPLCSEDASRGPQSRFAGRGVHYKHWRSPVECPVRPADGS
jgi:hypothetical protein